MSYLSSFYSLNRPNNSYKELLFGFLMLFFPSKNS
jgi:hypothetical protein